MLMLALPPLPFPLLLITKYSQRRGEFPILLMRRRALRRLAGL
jgi:hypothetical protein